MGDHRISIEIKFEMHGHKAKYECWLNWSDNIPDQISDWIKEQKEIAMDGYFNEQYEHEMYNLAIRENAERDKLIELKAKYE